MSTPAQMKIAIPSDDGVTVAFHFGRTRGFLVFAVNEGTVGRPEYRPANTVQHDCSCENGDRPSRHQAILDALTGCSAIVARGMGANMCDDLAACGISVAFTDVDDAAAAAALFVEDALPERTEAGCDDCHGNLL